MRTFLILIIMLFSIVFTASLGLAKDCTEIEVGCKCACSNGSYDDYIGRVKVPGKNCDSNSCQPSGTGVWKEAAGECLDDYGSSCKAKCSITDTSSGYYRFTMYPYMGQNLYGSSVGRVTIQFGNEIYQFFNDSQCYP